MNSSLLQSLREKPDGRFQIIDDNPSQPTHIVQSKDGSNIYIETENPELKDALTPFDGENHEKEVLSFISNLELARSIRDKLRQADIIAKLKELAARKRDLEREIEQIDQEFRSIIGEK